MTLNYTRLELIEFGQSKAANEPPKLFDLIDADEKRKEKIRLVLKSDDIWKSLNLNTGSKGNAAESSEQARNTFQQMISAAVTHAQQHNTDYVASRRRIGSGRIVDNFSARDNLYPIGMDVRYMRNKLFKDDGKMVKNWNKCQTTDMNWNHSDGMNHGSDMENIDAKSDEPEWANCGPISKHDIIELHGFDGPEAEETQKSESTVSPPARSTPSKIGLKKSGKTDDHFNFDEFFKLDLPAPVNPSRDHGASESRFSQWFGRSKLSHQSKLSGNSYDTKSTQQFFDYHQKANQKKMNAPNKLRSVDELEAYWCPNPAKIKEKKSPSMDTNAVRLMLSQLAAQNANLKQRSGSMNPAQTNFLLSLINKSAENLYQYRLSQNVIMRRPDAALLLNRLVSGEITQFHILQQISNPTLHQRDRETLLAVFAFCNENQQWLIQQQEQQKQKEQISQQLRQLQLIQLKNGGNLNQPTPTPQQLQIHTQNIMQNAMYKKQFEDQYRHFQNSKPKFPSRPKNI